MEKFRVVAEIVQRTGVARQARANSVYDLCESTSLCGYSISEVSKRSNSPGSATSLWPPLISYFSRRLELLARAGRFTEAAAVLQVSYSASPEEANIIRDVIKELRQTTPEKIDEFAKSILPWLELVMKGIS